MITKTSFTTSSPYHVHATDWIAARSSVYPIIPFTSHSPAPIHIHPEDGNCSVCRNDGETTAFNAAYPRNWKFIIELQPRKPKNKSITSRCRPGLTNIFSHLIIKLVKMNMFTSLYHNIVTNFAKKAYNEQVITAVFRLDWLVSGNSLFETRRSLEAKGEAVASEDDRLLSCPFQFTIHKHPLISCVSKNLCSWYRIVQ
jgi:hypothetical protein